MSTDPQPEPSTSEPAPDPAAIAAIERYTAAAHAMQSGVAMAMQLDPDASSPKHLRVGVNSAMVEHSALAALLIKKGIITELEYLTAIADAMEAERDTYVADLERILGTNVTLH